VLLLAERVESKPRRKTEEKKDSTEEEKEQIQ